MNSRACGAVRMAADGAALRYGFARANAAPGPDGCFDPLSEYAPDLSARVIAPPRQTRALIAGAAWLGAALVLAPLAVFALLGGLAFVLFAALIVLRYAAACAPGPETQATTPANDTTLPVYTILCPVYREAAALPGLVAALDRLDYPRALLDVLILTEPDDAPTHAAAGEWARARPWMCVLAAPSEGPRTKPKALNAGLARSRGELLTVFDAEDRPHPMQLRAAAAAFAAADGGLACVQAPLQVYNGAESWIAGQFALEYRVQFGRMLPLFTRMRWPILLGGTSNHFRASALRQGLGWDSYNVTEDADLGLRLARAGFRTGLIAPPTFEEAPIKLRAWRRQRTRWIKGHLVTWLVHMRRPRALLRDLGPWRFLGAQLTLGGGLASSIAHGPLLLCAAIMALSGADMHGAFAVSAWGYGAALACAARAAFEARDPRLVLNALTAPLYWPLQSWAALCALRELFKAPHVWAKTEHGLTAAAAPVIGVSASAR